MVPKHVSRILLIDKFGPFRESLKDFLDCQSDLTVCGKVFKLNKIFPTIQTTNPHAVLLAEDLPEMSSIDLGKTIMERFPNLRVIILIFNSDLELPIKAKNAGIHGYLFRVDKPKATLRGIRAVLAGKTYFASVPVDPNAFPDDPDPVANELALWGSLRFRQLELIRLIREGIDPIEICYQMHLEPQTIRAMRNKIYERLGVNNDIELIQFAIRHGL